MNIRYIIAVFLSVLAFFLILTISPHRTSGDFDVYYNASRNFMAGAPVYTAHNGIEEFKYLPLFALVFSPFAMLDKTPALYLWNIFSILLFYGMFYFLYKLKQISFDRPQDFLTVAFLFALTGCYLFTNIKLGQVNILLCFLMLLTMYLEINKKDLWAAVVLAFSLMIKFFPLLFLLYFILTKRFKIAGYTIMMTAFFLLLPAAYCGFDMNLKYLHEWSVLIRSSPGGLFYSVKNYSLLSFFSWIFVAKYDIHKVNDYNSITTILTPEVYYAWAAACFIFFTSFFYDVFYVKGRDLKIKCLDYACLFVCGLLFNPLSYLNAFILLTVPYVIILRNLFYGNLKKGYIFIVGFLLLLSFIFLMSDNHVFFKDPDLFYKFLVFKPLTWALVMAYLSLWLIKKEAL